MQEAKDLNPQPSDDNLKTPAIPDKEDRSGNNSPENDVEALELSQREDSKKSHSDKSFPQKLKKFVKECFSASYYCPDNNNAPISLSRSFTAATSAYGLR